MGSEVVVDAPPFAAHRFRVATDVPSAWIAREFRFEPVPRLMLSLVLPDRPLVLLKVLTAVDLGVVIPGIGSAAHLSPELRTVRFSVDGSLSSTLRGAFMTAMVLRPIIDDALARAVPDALDVVRQGLWSQVATALDEMGLPEEFSKNIGLYKFDGLGDELFAGCRYAEYSFGVRSNAKSSGSLIRVLADFSRVLGEAATPIAYLYFPDSRDGFEWAKLGVGAPSRAVDSLQLDLVANTLARRNKCRYLKYDPSRDVLADQRHSQIADYSTDESAQRETRVTEPHTDAIFAQGPARAGLIGDLLEGEPLDAFVAGSMTVIAGHTIACWLVPLGEGRGIAARLRRKGELLGMSVSGPLEVAPGLPEDGESCWVSWRCEDRPGIARLVVDELTQFISAPTGVLPNLGYEISRVLAAGQSCAGKIKITIPSDLPALDDAAMANLRQRLLMALPLDSNSGEPPEVLVARFEPTVEPWASLRVV